MAYATVNVRNRHSNRLLGWISEHTTDFDYTIVDHDNLADEIGKAVVRAINHCRTSHEPLKECSFVVDLHFGN